MKLSLIRIGSFVALAAAFAACSTGDDDRPSFSDDPRDDAGVTSGDASIGGDTGPMAPPSTCGNKKVDPGEACDDGNTQSGDGCSATCAIESAGPADVCDGVTLDLAQEDASTLYKARVTGSTAKLFNHYGASCGGGSGADAVYRIVPPMTGSATARVTAEFDAIVSVRTSCNDGKTEIGCSDGTSAGDAGAGAVLSFPVFANKPVFVFVDGYGGSKGSFVLDVDVQTAVCGNGKAEYPEECDDGNTNGGDGCSAACKMEDVASPSTCPGMSYRLKAGTASFAGDTATLANGGGSATGCASTGSGQNAIYALTPTVSGNLSLSLLAAYPGALLHVRRECAANATQVDCSGATDELVPLKASIPVAAEQTVYVFVDSSSTSNEGLYTLDATLTAAACGNGLVDDGEECDDGNKTDGDGCSATCAVERDPATYTCPGKALRLEGAAPGPRTVKVRGTTAPLPGETLPASKFSSCGNSGAADVVYQLTSDIDGYLTAKVKGDFNAAVALRAACPGTTDLTCAKTAPGNAQEVLNAPVNKETPYFVVVDGAVSGSVGPFELELTVEPSVCGNGVIEGGETCDDGATSDGDGCDATCRLETDKARDECATAPAVTLEPAAGGKYGATIVSGTTNLTHPPSPTHTLSPCSSTGPDGWFAITAPISGVITATVTSATFRSTIGVRTACAPSGSQLTCDDTATKGGQEIVFPVNEGSTYYLAIAGGFVSGTTQLGRFTVDLKLVPSGCGDTFVTGAEACDDGNTQDGDGCSATCTIESLPNVGSCPGHAVALTGTGSDVRRKTITVDTKTLASKTGSVCGGSGPEGVLAITSDVDGQLQVKAAPDAGYSALVYARTTCGDPTTEITKSSCSGSNLTTVNAAVKKNIPTYVFVDGMNASSGVAKLSITVTP